MLFRSSEAARGSARCISVKGGKDVHAEGRARPQENQHGAFRCKDERTYKLREERGHKRISMVHFGERTRGRTS